MNAIDGTEHVERPAQAGTTPSLLVVILDTNPYAWTLLSSTLPLDKAVAQLLIFVNAHLAFNHSNRVALIASHCQRTAWLYPTPTPTPTGPSTSRNSNPDTGQNPNAYRPFALIQTAVQRNLRALFAQTTPDDLSATTTTALAGALTQALNYINKTALVINPESTVGGGPGDLAGPPTTSAAPDFTGAAAEISSNETPEGPLNARILVVSASGDLAGQYIPLMNCTFAAQHARIPIDILKLAGDAVLLQQASYTTSGIFVQPPPLSTDTAKSNGEAGDSGSVGTENAAAPRSKSETINPRRVAPTTAASTLLPTLMAALLPSPALRRHLVLPTSPDVDFRAACFCHRRVVDIGFVCSICLSIFCDQSEVVRTGICLTCGSQLSLRELKVGGPVRKKKKKKDKRPGLQGVDSGVDSGAG